MPQHHSRRVAWLTGAAFAAGAVCAVAARAATPPDQPSEVGEIVVSAPHYVPIEGSAGTKTNTPIIQTPQSVSVITRDQIDVLNWQSTQQAVRYTAGVNGENFGPDQRYDYVTVRGFYPVEYIDGLQAPIAPASSLNDIGVDLWGFDQIEILKGPASVLYGESPPGGLLNLTSRRPQDAFSGEVRGQYGSYNTWELAGDVTGPLTNGLDARLTALYRDNGTQVDFERHRRLYVAPSLTWNIDPNTTLTFLGFYQSDRDRGCCGGFLPEQGTLLPNPNGVIPPSRNFGEPGYNNFSRDEGGAGYSFRHAFDAHWSFEQDFKYFYYRDDTTEVYGAGLEPDLVTEDRYNFKFPERIQEYAVDSRLNGVFDTGPVHHELLVGIDYRDYTNFTQFGFGLAPSINAFFPVYGAPITALGLFNDINERQDQTGLYVQDQAKFAGFILTLGGRQDWLNTDDHLANRSTNNDKFTYRVGLSYLFPQGVAPYVSYATSFEPTPGSDFGGHPFGPSTGDQIEGGVKFEPTFLPRAAHLLATAAAYQIVQNNVLTPDPAHVFFSVQTGQVRVDGVELEAVARIFERFSLNGSYTYTDSKVTRGNADVGDQLFETPRNKVSLFADYTAQSGFLAGLGAGLGVRYLSSSFGDSANLFRNPSVTLFDAIVHYDIAHWRFAVNANNMLDKVYVARCSAASQCFYGERRVVALTVSRKW